MAHALRKAKRFARSYSSVHASSAPGLRRSPEELTDGVTRIRVLRLEKLIEVKAVTGRDEDRLVLPTERGKRCLDSRGET